MLFNSLEFALFLIIVFIIYWLLNKRLKIQNLFILVASYFFYGWWDWKCLILIAFTSFCSYLSGILIEKYRTNNTKGNYSKIVATTNVVLNLLILCVFKYFNFFAENFALLFNLIGIELDWVTLKILLPVGISFYTFQALSYTLDVYKKKIEATHDFVAFLAFVSFFPQLVAGPIERATNLLPQFYFKRSFNYEKAVVGLRQMLWGFFKKILIADNCAFLVNQIFDSYQDMSGSTLFLGAILFTLQIYGDFSGYSDIALGTAKLFGFDLMRNFNFPYFSRDIAEFWRRWHISLTTWFRDYIYIPLGGSRGGRWMTFRNTMVIFLVSGFWHGANWTFIVWGAYHALLFAPLVLLGKNRKYIDNIAQGRVLPSLSEFLKMAGTFLLVVLGWIIFRAASLEEAFGYIGSIFSKSLFSIPSSIPLSATAKALFFSLVLLIVEWFARNKQFALETIPVKSRILRWAIYYVIIACIIIFGGSQSAFIYFQF